MRWMSGRARLATVALAVIAAVVAGGCSGGGGAAGDKAGGAGEPAVLRMANAYGDLDVVPAVQDFVSRVKERSGGNLRIQVAGTWGDYADDAEQQVVRAVAAGEADLGWAGARVFDTMGVSSFQALQAPMLIDSYALEQAVADTLSGIGMHHDLLSRCCSVHLRSARRREVVLERTYASRPQRDGLGS